MTTVYLVIWAVEYEGEETVGVYATRELAEAHAARYNKHARKIGRYEVKPWEVRTTLDTEQT